MYMFYVYLLHILTLFEYVYPAFVCSEDDASNKAYPLSIIFSNISLH